jgi:hypothetical protein
MAWSVICLALMGASQQGRPEPDQAAQKEAEGRVRGTFKAEYAKRGVAESRDLARRLLENGMRTQDDDALKFVLLREARDVAARACDAETALRAAEEAGRHFDVDPIALKLAALSKIAGAAKGADAVSALASGYFLAAQEAAAANRYDDALKSLAAAEANARAAKDMALMALCQSTQRDVAEIRREFQKLKPDAPDRTPAGAFLCLVKRDFQNGLPLLAQGTDASLRAVAEKDLAGPSDAQRQAEAGDAWWDLGTSEMNALKRRNLQDRAVHWYRQCAKRLPAGTLRARAEARVAIFEIQAFGDEVELVPGVPSRTRGLKVAVIDGASAATSHMGRSCLKLTNIAQAGSNIYVDVPDSWASVESQVEVTVEYFDGPSGQAGIEHNTLDPQNRIPQLAATSPYPAKLGNTGTWKTVVGRVSSREFRNTCTTAIGVESDFRVHCLGDEIHIGRISCRRVK